MTIDGLYYGDEIKARPLIGILGEVALITTLTSAHGFLQNWKGSKITGGIWCLDFDKNKLKRIETIMDAIDFYSETKKGK